MSQPYRTAGAAAEGDRKPLSFRFDNRELQGVEGDTLASALLANGIHLTGRSFKYHRPRGIMSSGVEEANALVEIDRGEGRVTPNTRATTQELFDGLVARSQNRWPSLRFDLGALIGVMSRFLPAGFYYKTFLWPGWGWKYLYEPLIRRTAGLGRATSAADPDRYSNRFAHCDVLIVGAGPAGLSAALSLANSGKRVILCDERPGFGGSLVGVSEGDIEGLGTSAWLSDALARIREADNIIALPRTTAFGYYGHNYVCLAQRCTDHLAQAPDGMPRERLWQLRAKQVFLCTGAIERPLVFANNDRPGILLASAAQAYANRFNVAVGRKVVIATNNDSAYPVALDLLRAGITVRAIIDSRDSVDTPLKQTAQSQGVEVLTGAEPVNTRGRQRIRSVEVQQSTGQGATPMHSLQCDALLTSGGWTPTLHLHSQAGGKLFWNAQIGAFLPVDSLDHVLCLGAAAGFFSLEQSVADSAACARRLLQTDSADALAAIERPAHGDLDGVRIDDAHGTALDNGQAVQRSSRSAGPGLGKAFVDFQNDATENDIHLAVREGFVSIEHIKRYTTTGMATDQGKTSNINGLFAAAGQLGQAPAAVGLTTFRPPYTPVTFGCIAHLSRDVNLDPVRHTPLYAWAKEAGAVFEDVGQWKRARYFPRAQETMQDAVNRECLATRSAVGAFDASTLGKIEVVGPDASRFMDLMYANAWSSLESGRCRYGLMLGEDGYIFDDGVVGKLAHDRFHVTTTTGGAARVMAHMEDYLQTEFPDLDVWLTSVTEQWAVIALNGPKARVLLSTLVDDIDLEAAQFPHMSVRIGHMLGVPIRLFRVSFTGELGFEVNVPADEAAAIWQAIMDAGKQWDITAYGTEAMHVMRAEKGFIIVGQDTDGTVTPDDAGMQWAVGKQKTDFVGMRSLLRPDLQAEGRKQLVGLRSVSATTVLEEGAQLLSEDGQRAVGHVTSAYWSATLQQPIALALLESGRSRQGSSVSVTDHAGSVQAEVCDSVFYDSKGERLRG